MIVCVVKRVYVVYQLEKKVMQRFDNFTTIKDVIIIVRKTDQR